MEKEAGLRPGVAAASRFLDDSGDLRRRVGWGRGRKRDGDAFVFIGFAVFFGGLTVEVGVWSAFAVWGVLVVWVVFAVLSAFAIWTGFAVLFGGVGVGRVVVDENEVGAGPFDGERELVRFPTVEFLRRPTAFGDAGDACRWVRFD